MSEQASSILIIIGSLLILYGMARLIYINHPNPQNVNLVNWMFTGGIIQLVLGLMRGFTNTVRLIFDANAIATLAIVFGIGLMAIAL